MTDKEPSDSMLDEKQMSCSSVVCALLLALFASDAAVALGGTYISRGQDSAAEPLFEPSAPCDVRFPFIEEHKLLNANASSQLSPTVCWPGERAERKDGFRLMPYGAFWADMIYATSRTHPGAFTLFVLSNEDQGEPAFTIDARRTRLGLDVFGPKIPSLEEATNGGKVEIDFHGNFVTENRASLLLRHAYWELKSDSFRLLVGQTWDVISPLNPGMLDYAVGLNAGNIGFRRTQFRAERYLSFSETLGVTLQASLNQDIVADFPAEAGVRREPSDWPVVEARSAFNWEPREGQSIVLGVSGHVGETGFDFIGAGPPPLNLPPKDDRRIRTWSYNVDLQVPITRRLAVQGEFFTGANLSAFFGGVGQGVCPCLRMPIRSTGGWGQVRYDWSSRLHSHVGYGLDDPRNRDSLLGRTYNHMIFANIIFDVADGLITGLEVTHRKTLYQETRAGLIPADQLTPSEPGEAVILDWMVKYEF